MLLSVLHPFGSRTRVNRITLPSRKPATDRPRTIRARAYALSDRLDPAAEHAREMLRALDLDLDLDSNLGRDCNRPLLARGRPGSAAIEWACSGAMMLTGSPDAPPEFANGALASAARGAGLALETLAPGSGLAAIDAPALLGERAAIDGLARRGNISVGGSARLLATSRGGLVLNLPREEDWQLIPAWVETARRELASSRDWNLLARLVADRDRVELVDRGRIMGLAIAPVAPPSMSSPLPGPTTTPNNHPLLDLRQATEAKAPGSRLREKRLLDLSSLWAGPLATSLLAMAGIEVLKIESPTRPDGARHGSRGFFDLMNGNKQGCALDLREPADRSIFEQLLESADIVVESARPRALQQLGFDASSWVSDRPGRIWASITGYGRAREWIAFGDDAAVAAGLAWAPGVSASSPRFCGDAIADPLAGLHAAVAILALLEKGRGGLLDLSLVDIAAYAAAIENDGLVLPIEVESKRWCVIEDAERIPIEKPRARTNDWIAPKLEAPDAALISEWTRPC